MNFPRLRNGQAAQTKYWKWATTKLLLTPYWCMERGVIYWAFQWITSVLPSTGDSFLSFGCRSLSIVILSRRINRRRKTPNRGCSFAPPLAKVPHSTCLVHPCYCRHSSIIVCPWALWFRSSVIMAISRTSFPQLNEVDDEKHKKKKKKKNSPVFSILLCICMTLDSDPTVVLRHGLLNALL